MNDPLQPGPGASGGGEILLEVDSVSKRFCRDLKRSLFYGVKDIAADCLGRNRDGTPLRKDEFWALKDVSFTLRRGECLGLIGANGAGKTTLLRIINGLIKPDHGEVRIRGRVGALIALGAGFNPVLTGRENIFVNAAVLGLSKRQTDARLEQIIAFADIGDAIDAPVQSYSSGMTVRLGFAIAAHLEPDILLIDEVLAVGDAAFRAKCYETLGKIKDEAALIFVSHSAHQIARICNRAMTLEKGVMQFIGSVVEAQSVYRTGWAGGIPLEFSKTNSEVRLVSFSLGDASCKAVFGGAFSASIILHSLRDLDVILDLTFRNSEGQPVAECATTRLEEGVSLRAGTTKVSLIIPQLTLNPDNYSIGFFCLCPQSLFHYVWIENIANISVTGIPGICGQQFIGEWSLNFQHNENQKKSILDN